MKKLLSKFWFVVTICLFCTLYMFLFDLLCIGRIAKFNHIWFVQCPFDADGAHLNCMANYDIVSIVIILCVLCLLLFYLFKTYRKWVLLIPICGFLLFSLSVINWEFAMQYIPRPSGGGIAGRIFQCIAGKYGQCRPGRVRRPVGAQPTTRDTVFHN